MCKSEVGQSVHSFYQTLHFNEGSDALNDANLIESGALTKAQLLPSFRQTLVEINSQHGTVLEAGCGIGWLSLSINKVYPFIKLHAVDFSERALVRAQEISIQLGTHVQFQIANLLDKSSMEGFEGVDAFFSIGVLHHTGNFEESFQNCLSLLKPGGSAYIGLYHKYRRGPFLAYFERLSADGQDEECLRREYAQLDRRSSDPVRQESWFKDQVLHPHETQHTIQEVLDVAGVEFEHVSNSITHEKVPGREALLHIEKRQEVLGQKNLELKTYDPGFFMVHIRKKHV